MPRPGRETRKQRLTPLASKSMSSMPTAKTKAQSERSSPCLVKGGGAALLWAAVLLLEGQPAHLSVWAAPQAPPAVHVPRQYVTAGGLVSYGTNFADAYRLAGSYLGKILS